MKYELMNHSMDSEELEKDIIQHLESEPSRLREQIAEYAMEAEPGMDAWAQHLNEKYEKEWREVSPEDPPNPTIYFIPSSKQAEYVNKYEQTNSNLHLEGMFAVHLPDAESVV